MNINNVIRKFIILSSGAVREFPQWKMKINLRTFKYAIKDDRSFHHFVKSANIMKVSPDKTGDIGFYHEDVLRFLINVLRNTLEQKE